jgi:hypothetical protein
MLDIYSNWVYLEMLSTAVKIDCFEIFNTCDTFRFFLLDWFLDSV